MSAVAEIVPTEMPAPFVFTDSAASKVAELIAEEGNPDLKLRAMAGKVVLTMVASSVCMKKPMATSQSNTRNDFSSACIDDRGEKADLVQCAKRTDSKKPPRGRLLKRGAGRRLRLRSWIRSRRCWWRSGF